MKILIFIFCLLPKKVMSQMARHSNILSKRSRSRPSNKTAMESVLPATPNTPTIMAKYPSQKVCQTLEASGGLHSFGSILEMQFSTWWSWEPFMVTLKVSSKQHVPLKKYEVNVEGMFSILFHHSLPILNVLNFTQLFYNGG